MGVGLSLWVVRRAYVAQSTPMVIYLNTNAALQQMRTQSARDGSRGPRLMVMGPMDVGKSTVCRILLNYATRVGESLMLVDLDVGQGQISVPGTVGALYVERPADIVEGFDKRAPLVYHFGHLSPGENVPLFRLLLNKLAAMVNQKSANSRPANIGGVIINTCGWVKGEGYSCLVDAVEAFEADVVVVIDHERLYNELQRDLPHFVRIVHQPKSGGVEERTRQQRIASRKERIREYFMPNKELLHRLLAVSLCEVVDQELLTTNVAGFVVVTEVHMERETMTILSPQPYPLPRKILLWSEVNYLDSMT